MQITEKEEINPAIDKEVSTEKQRTTEYLKYKALENQKEATRKYKIATIILGFIALLGVAGTVYFMNFATPKSAISKSKYDKEVHTLQNKIASLNETVKELSISQELGSGDVEPQSSLTDQVVYAVQIGAFEKKDLSMYSDGFVNFREIRSENFNKYSIGNFETLTEAQQFRKEIIELGFRNAFIASYKNDKRIRIEKPR